jgi:hypothetical protein
VDDVLDRGERFEFRALPRVPWRLRLRRMTPAHSGVTVDTDAVRVRAGTWWMTIRFDEIAGARVTEWPHGARIGVHYLGRGRWMVASAAGELVTLNFDPAVMPTTFPRTSQLDLGLTDPQRFVSSVRSHISR